jgi:RHS repeat-associated protein
MASRSTGWVTHVLLFVLLATAVLAATALFSRGATAATGDAVDVLPIETLHANGVELEWTKYTGPSGAPFDKYEIHRSTAADFTPSASTLLTTVRDVSRTSYRDTTAAPGQTFSYKIVANSSPSLEQRVTLPASGKGRKVLQPAPAVGKATYVEKASSGSVSCTNAGAKAQLLVGASTWIDRPLIQFELQDLPAKAKVTSATLTLYRDVAAPKAATIDVHRVRGEWVEGKSSSACSGSGTSWDETEGGVDWNAKGGDFESTPAASVELAAGQAAGPDTFNVAPIVQDFTDGKAPNHGFLLKTRDETSTADNTVSYMSDDEATYASRRPKLVVEYDEDSPSKGPGVKIASPEAGSLVKGTVTVDAEAGDDRRVEKVEFFVDGVSIGTDTAAPWAVSWDSATATNASHTLTAKATDDVGNTTTSPGLAVTVGNSAPPAAKVMSPSSIYADMVTGFGAYAHWRLGETAGTTVADATGRGNAGTLSGSYLLGQTGLLTNDADKAITFEDATTDGRAAAGPSLSGQSSARVSVEAWVDYQQTADLDQESVIAERGWGSAGGWRLSVYKDSVDGKARAKWAVNVADTVKQITWQVAPGRLHLIGRYTGSSVSLFVNGAYTYGASTATQSLNTSNSVFIGGNVSEGLRIDEVALYGKSMTTDEASVHYDVGVGRTPRIKASHTVWAAASDDRGVTKVNFYVDGARFATDTTSPYAASLDTLDASEATFDGNHSITTRSYDADGNETQSAAQTVEVVNTAGTPFKADVAATTEPPIEVTYDGTATTQQKSGVTVNVKNTSGQTWTADDYVIKPRWATPEPTPTYVEQAEVSLGSDLAPGATKTADVLVEPPALPDGVERAQYELQVDVYKKSQTAFFADKGNKPFAKPVTVKRRSTSDDLGLERFYHYEGEELGGGMQHLTNVATGNSLVRFTPAVSTGRGLSTVLDLTYNSLEKKSESPVGNNWSLSVSGLARFGNPIDIHPNKADEIAGNANRFVDFTDGDGTTHRFVGKQASDGTVYWEEPAGVHLYLRTTGSTDPARKWAITRPDRVTYFFDADGYPTLVEDANGNKITYTLEATPPGEDPGGPKKRITAITDAGGRQFKIVYWGKADSNRPKIRGKIRKIIDHSGMEVTFQYYEDGNLLRIAQTGGNRADGSNLSSRGWYFTYTTPSGDGPAIPLQEDRMYPDPRTSSQSTRLFSVRDPRRHETTFEYAGPGAGQSRWKLTSKTNRTNEKTTYAYDEVSRATTATAPLGRVTKYAFDGQAQVTQITNAKGEDTSIVWTADRHVQKVARPRTATTTTTREFAYDQNGQLTDVWDELRNRTQLEYEYVTADGNDVSGKWKQGRTVPHISQLARKTDPKGTATASPTDDYQWSFAYDTSGNLKTATDPEKKATTYSYNADGTLSSSTDALNRVTRFTAYDPSGQPTEVVDAKAQVTRFGYDADGYLRWVQDPNHADDTGAEPREHRTYFDYDTWHRMGRQSTPLSTKNRRGELVWSSVDFDDNDNAVEQIAPHYGKQYSGTGARTTVDYDHMDRTWYITGSDKSADPAGERWHFEYDGAGRLRRVTNPGGFFTESVADDGTETYEYDELDRVIQSYRHEVEGGAVKGTLRTHACFDVAGDLRAVVPPKAAVTSVDCSNLSTLPRATRFEYDDAHRLMAETDALNHRQETRYDANGDVEATVDEQNQATSINRDQLGRVTQVTEPFDAATGRKLTTKLEYDDVGNLVREISPRAWDASADKSTFSEYVTRYEYDAVDQMVKQLLPTSGATPTQLYVHRAYDPNGNLTMTSLPDSSADPATVDVKKKTQLTLFDTGWIESSSDRAKPKVRFEYTAEGWQRLRTPDKPGGGPNLARQREWLYFPDGMLKEERVATDEDNSATNTFAYDANNNLTSAHNATGLAKTTTSSQKPIDVTADYDTLDRPIKVRQRKEGEANWNVTLMGYDLNGNVTSRTENREEDASTGALAKAGREHRFTYDEADWLSTHLDYGTSGSSSDDRRITNTFFPTGWAKERLIEQADSAGAFSVKQRTSWTYFLNGDLNTLVTKNGDGVVKQSHDLSYLDAAGHYVNGHRTKDVFKIEGPKTDAPCRTAVCTTTYQYDARERLLEEKTDRDVGSDPTIKYELDAAGNVITEEHLGVKSPWTEKATFAGDQLETRTFSGSQTGSFKYFYDGAGNMNCVTTSAGTKDICTPPAGTTPSKELVAAYAYDTDDRLVSHRAFGLDANGQVEKTKDAEYVYDGFDRPVEQTENHKGFAEPRVTLFKYVGLRDDVSEEEQRKSTADGALDETKSYTYDAFGQRIAMTNTKGSETKDLTFGLNAHGSISLLLNDAGKAQAAYGYSAYGESDKDAYGADESYITTERDPFDTSNSDPSLQRDVKEDSPLNPYRYSGKRLDTGSGTLDMGARRFGPDTAQFLQEDVYQDALADLSLSTDPLTQNRYGLAGGNPVNFVEVDGHEPASSYTDRRSVNYYYSRRKRRTSGTSYSERAAESSRPTYQRRIDTAHRHATARVSRQRVVASEARGRADAARRRVGSGSDLVSGGIEGASIADNERRDKQYRADAEREARRGAARTGNRTIERRTRMAMRTGRVPYPGPKVPAGLQWGGRVVAPVGGAITYVNSQADGESVGKSVAETAGATVGGTIGGVAGAFLCAPSVIGAAGCGAGGAVGGSIAGEQIGSVVYEAGDTVVDTVGDAGGAVGDFLSGI